MRLLRWSEVGLHTEVDFDAIGLEPAAATSRQVWWLGRLGQTQQSLVEGSCPTLFANRHRQLHVLDSTDTHDQIIDKSDTSIQAALRLARDQFARVGPYTLRPALSSADTPRSELYGDTRPYRSHRLGNGVLPCSLTASPHHHQVAVIERETQ